MMFSSPLSRSLKMNFVSVIYAVIRMGLIVPEMKIQENPKRPKK